MFYIFHTIHIWFYSNHHGIHVWTKVALQIISIQQFRPAENKGWPSLRQFRNTCNVLLAFCPFDTSLQKFPNLVSQGLGSRWASWLEKIAALREESGRRWSGKTPRSTRTLSAPTPTRPPPWSGDRRFWRACQRLPRQEGRRWEFSWKADCVCLPVWQFVCHKNLSGTLCVS